VLISSFERFLKENPIIIFSVTLIFDIVWWLSNGTFKWSATKNNIQSQSGKLWDILYIIQQIPYLQKWKLKRFYLKYYCVILGVESQVFTIL
jgi:hypothetical protein